MSVLIRGMEMPKNCDVCWKKYHGFGMVEHDEEWGTFYCKLAKGFCSDPRTKCPLVPVPPHGRLGDLDELARKIEHDRYNHTHTDGLAARHHIAEYGHFLNAIAAAPTIIPAEEVYDKYTDTAGNLHWTGTHSGKHIVKAEEGE